MSNELKRSNSESSLTDSDKTIANNQLYIGQEATDDHGDP